MAAIYSSHGFYERLLKVPVWQLYTATVSIILVLISAWWCILYAPMSAAMHTMDTEIERVTIQIPVLQKAEQSAFARNEVLAKMKVPTADLKKRSHKEIIRSAVLAITNAASHNSIAMNACRIMQQTVDQRQVNHIAIECKGSLDQLIAFFDELKKNNIPLEYSKFNLALAGQNIFNVQTTCMIF